VTWAGTWLMSVVLVAVPATRPAGLEPAGIDVFIPNRAANVRTGGFALYTRAAGPDLMRLHTEETESDKVDVTWQSFSSDNGRTWSQATPVRTAWTVAGGTRRRYIQAGFVDPVADVLVLFIIEGVLPGDDPLEGMKHWGLRVALSRDGGRTFYHESPVVHRGAEFSPEHPLPGVWIGKNSVMIGDTTCVPIRIRTGEVLQPVQITPLGPDGEYHNPGGGHTYHDAAVLIGRWTAAGTLDWELSAYVRGDPARTTRGLLEPTLAELPDGRILMVMRGSNDRRPALPGYRWYALSADAGRTWSEPQPWTFTDGRPFFSPSSCSQLLRHSNGRYYWIGNVSPVNPRGNAPRYPLVIGEVDPRTALLKPETLCTLDDRQTTDAPYLAFSNFYAREDRETGEILVYCAPLGRRRGGPAADTRPAAQFEWTADALIYRARVTAPHR